MYAQPTAGLAEIEPSMEWNPSVVSGVGVVSDVTRLYSDMHSYLAASGAPLPARQNMCVCLFRRACAVSGVVGVVADMKRLFSDVRSYLAASGALALRER